MAIKWPGGDASKLVADRSLQWANNDPANTEKTFDLGSPDDVARQPNAGLLVIVRNPSAVTELAGEIRVQYVDGGATRFAKLTSFSAVRSNADGEAFLIDGGLLVRTQIALKNSTLLGVADAFAARVVVYAF